MLNDLIVFGIHENYFEIKRIGNFPNAHNDGISHINTSAIDFDTTKQKICAEHGQDQCKSCDALDIIPSKNKINFIEFKELIDTPDIIDFINDLELPQKIKDSRDILLSVIRKQRFNHPQKIPKFRRCEKNVIISFNLTNEATRRAAIFLRWFAVKAVIEKQFTGNSIEGENFNYPVCIKTTNFDTAYLGYC